EERLELLDGEIIRRMTQRPPHAVVVAQAASVLTQAFGTRYHVRPQLPLVLNDWSEPEPDAVVAPGTPFDYLAEHPKAADAPLVVEVADTTLRFDRARKRAAYARLHRQVEFVAPRRPAVARSRSIRAAPAGSPGSPPHSSLSAP